MLLKPITAGEVSRVLGKMKAKTAAELGGVDLRSFKGFDPDGSKLAKVFTQWLLHKWVLDELKEGRNILLPNSLNPSSIGN